MKKMAMATLVALHALPAAVADARDHVPGCKTPDCDKRIGRKWARKHRVKASTPATVSWYGPGLYGNHLACGGTLEPGTAGVAHKTLPCGTRVRLCLRRCVTTRVIDRGPYVAGRTFDLTAPVRDAIGMSGVATVRYAVLG
jgi:rare lipoprotein A (peptidoglycan hydrolase)